MVQAKILCRPGPSGPEGINTWNRILCAGNFAEGRRGIPRNRGSGGGATMGGDAHRSPPPGGVLVPFLPEKKELAQRAKPSARNKTIPNIGGRVRRPAPTTFQADHSRTGKREGQAPPLRDGVEAFCAGGCTESTTPRRTLTKKGMAGLNYHKMYHNVPLLTSARHGWRCFLWLAITRQIINYVNGRQTTR